MNTKSPQDMFEEQLCELALSLANEEIKGYKHYLNTEGEEDFAFHAAENMMNEYDYYRGLVWDKEPEYRNILYSLSPEIQKELVNKFQNNEYIDWKYVRDDLGKDFYKERF